MSATNPSNPVPAVSQEEYLDSMLGQKGILVRLTFASGSSVERSYALLHTAHDPSTRHDQTTNELDAWLTRAFAIGDLLATHATGFLDSLLVHDNRHHHVDLSLADDPIVNVEVMNVRIPNPHPTV